MLVCKSTAIAGEARSIGVDRSKIKIFYNPIDNNIFKPVGQEQKENLRQKLGLPKEKKIITYVGRFHSRKGTDLLLELWEKIHNMDPSLYLVMIGAPWVGDKTIYEKYPERYKDSAYFSARGGSILGKGF